METHHTHLNSQSIPEKNFTSVSADEFDELIHQSNTLMIDIRTPEEFVYGHITGALNVTLTDPTDSFEEKITILNKSKKVALYGRSGVRSKIAAQLLASAGFEVLELDGGIFDWLANGKPIEELEE
ncbi:MAG: rhodanese-like domain-containing protein [Bacteroidales bacterium]|nr:rhodanese-like domain-containing protein [Bacteroidales bacterium]